LVDDVAVDDALVKGSTCFTDAVNDVAMWDTMVKVVTHRDTMVKSAAMWDNVVECTILVLALESHVDDAPVVGLLKYNIVGMGVTPQVMLWTLQWMTLQRGTPMSKTPWSWLQPAELVTLLQ
jgi:hypothetical protein